MRQVIASAVMLLSLSPSSRAGDESLTVAPGLVVERVASSPLVLHPIMAAFDDHGRLYVADNTGENLDAKQLAARNPGRIRRLEDRDGDGVFDTATDFATGLTFPMGAQWHDGALYVASPPDILRLEDRDGDGKAERREAIVSGFIYTGNAADNHGPFLGPDGWLYFTHGRHGYKLPSREGPVLEGLAAQVFRCRTDGRGLERACGGGMDNPVEVAFNRAGEMFGTLTFYSDPTGGLRDAIVHWVEEGVYPKVHDCLKEFRRSGPLLPALRHWPATAPSGLALLRGNGLGADATGSLVSAQFNTATVQRHPLRRSGASYQSEDIDLLHSSDPDFHPTDVLEDADGSVLVVNTGGWFRRGCPRSVSAKPDLLGAIYRIRDPRVPRVSDPWGLVVGWSTASPRQLVALLDDPRFAVRDQAIAALAKRGTAVIDALAGVLADARSPEARAGAVWALARIGTPASVGVIRTALRDAERDVRIAACHALGLARDTQALPMLAALAVLDEPPVRRQAATALGQIGPGRPDVAPALLEGLKAVTSSDAFLEHGLVQALIDVNDPVHTRSGLSASSPVVRRGALVALDQMAAGDLKAADAVPLLDSPDAPLRSAGLAVVARHPAWAGAVVGVLTNWLGRADRDAAAAASLGTLLAALESERAIEDWVAAALAGRAGALAPAQQVLLVDVIARSRRPSLPGAWQEALGTLLDAGDAAVCRRAVEAIRTQRVTRHDARLEAIAESTGAAVDLRLAALGALAGRQGPLRPELFAFLTALVARTDEPVARLGAAEALAASVLTDDQAIALAGRLASADPLVLPPLFRSFRRSSSLAVGRALLAALEGRRQAGLALPPDLAEGLKTYPAEISAAARPLVEALAAGRPDARSRLDGLVTLLEGGDASRGLYVFFGNKANCYGCHKVGDNGGAVGPDLTTIGAVRSPRDLIEAIVDPSATFAQGFEPVALATTDGRVLSGVIARQDGGAVVLRAADKTEVRLRPDEVEEIRASPTSIMPQGLDSTLSTAELRDLLSYLRQLGRGNRRGGAR
jgi:putative heme-binding domain-containing protein